MNDCTIIIGAGQAGIQAAASLRSLEYSGRIVIVSEEDAQPYQKPPLSKGFLMGVQQEKNLYFRAPEFYADKQIELILGLAVQSIDTEKKIVRLADQSELGYTDLILATGSQPKSLPGVSIDEKLVISSNGAVRNELRAGGAVTVQWQ